MKTPQELIAAIKPTIKEVSTIELGALLANGEPVIIDVREHEEYIKGHIRGSVNIPRGLLEYKIKDHPKVAYHCDEKKALEELAREHIYLVCRTGGRSAMATHSLMEMGFTRVFSVMGGINEWEQNGLEIVQ